MPSGNVPRALRDRVRELDDGRCAYRRTPENLSVASFEIDRIVPVVKGGETILENLCLSCPSCNRHKGSKRSVVDRKTGERIPSYHPRRQVWSDHFECSEEWTRLEGLTESGRATVELLNINRPQMARLRLLWIKLGEWPES